MQIAAAIEGGEEVLQPRVKRAVLRRETPAQSLLAGGEIPGGKEKLNS